GARPREDAPRVAAARGRGARGHPGRSARAWRMDHRRSRPVRRTHGLPAQGRSGVTLRLDLLPLLLAVTLASFACRAGGFWLMRLVNVTPRIQAALKAAPLAVMAGIVVPAALHGGAPEWLGLIVCAGVMRFTHRDLIAALSGVGTLAIARAMLG